MINIELNLSGQHDVINLEEFVKGQHQFGMLFKWDTSYYSPTEWSKIEVVIFVCNYKENIIAIDRHGNKVSLGCGKTKIKVISPNPNVSLVIDG